MMIAIIFNILNFYLIYRFRENISIYLIWNYVIALCVEWGLRIQKVIKSRHLLFVKWWVLKLKLCRKKRHYHLWAFMVKSEFWNNTESLLKSSFHPRMTILPLLMSIVSMWTNRFELSPFEWGTKHLHRKHWPWTPCSMLIASILGYSPGAWATLILFAIPFHVFATASALLDLIFSPELQKAYNLAQALF